MCVCVQKVGLLYLPSGKENLILPPRGTWAFAARCFLLFLGTTLGWALPGGHCRGNWHTSLRALQSSLRFSLTAMSLCISVFSVLPASQLRFPRAGLCWELAGHNFQPPPPLRCKASACCRYWRELLSFKCNLGN